VIADRAYDHDKYRRELCRRGVKPVIARRCTDHGSGLGRVCWVVERTFAWLRNFRRLRIRWERDAGLHYALLSLGCSRDLLAPHPIVRHGRGRCSYAWKAIAKGSLPLSTDAGATGMSIALRQTTAARPRRASGAPRRRRPHQAKGSSAKGPSRIVGGGRGRAEPARQDLPLAIPRHRFEW
jgi:hypothetical protein